MAIKTIYYNDGNTYVGETNNQSQPHGKGKMTFTSSDFLDGNFKNGKLNGEGSYLLDGERYVGDFVNDCRDGMGECTYQDGTRYDGEWKGDEWCGEGVLFLTDGTTIEAVWDEYSISGAAIVRYRDGSIYQGLLKDGPCQESDYIGDKKRKIDVWHAEGTYVLPDGTRISGFWNDYKASDSLILIGSDNIPVKGSMRDGEFIPSEAHARKDVKEQASDLQNALKSALEEKERAIKEAMEARTALSEAEKRIAELENRVKELEIDIIHEAQASSAPESDTYDGATNYRGEYHGAGVMKYKSGDIYSGEWAHGEWHGFGLYVSAAGKSYFGFFCGTGESQNISYINGIDIPAHGKMEDYSFIPDKKK